MKKLIFLMAVITMIQSCQQSKQEPTEEVSIIVNDLSKARLDSVLQSFVTDSIVAGASALIIEKGKEAYFNAYGFADREAGVPMARNTIATIYSMTKPITGTTLMSLYEKGLFKLEDSLSQYAPEFANMKVATLNEDGEVVLVPANRPITIADITRHTAGFSRRSDLGLDQLNAEADLLNLETSLTDMAAKLSELPLGYQPGTRWEYGISVDVQAYLAEKLAEKPFAEYMREIVLDPLKMNETGYYIPEEKRDRVAAIYYKTDSSLTRIPDEQVHTINYEHWPMTPGGWGLKSTIDEYMIFAQMLLNKGSLNETTILQPETVELMATNHLPAVEDSLWLPSKGQVGFGIDFAVRVAEPKTAEENNGAVGEFYWDGAATTLFIVDPKNELTAVLFVQVMPFQGVIHKKFRDALYGNWK
ncbi:MAG: serine hydrolase [Flammeovirgaceae bacterium]|nr:serine hydrolase [Flammeovirgaceae bacterium]MBE61403.1 serine hydrolase [Flammeovirgaceae bacterium]MBR09785.1 serine hydrolase [Rickettsiales bacterium]|tara:strand:- start:691 stop:1941 length:1251 start_codon:yes stop_codon:yes gene_type:complete